ncbi:hypothetical protein Poly51_31100 [Rubripirellula tenax]|uniref:Uncharacterized protein n=1 Tax=Rubripirellula tenax TaxID=2528015 RepID=A0A5C6EZ98_9BACT|nr:hypothetical protein [Rubripirellula tenax]TWU54392.1 hypothetical protein Poly51_31100 [Rubripirellula tenax]
MSSKETHLLSTTHPGQIANPTIEIGQHHHTAAQYIKQLEANLQYIQLRAESRAFSLTALAEALICGRFVGNNPKSRDQTIFKRRNYCRRTGYCLMCKSIQQAKRSEIVVGRVPRRGLRVHSYVFTTPKPNNKSDELRSANFANEGRGRIAVAIGAYNKLNTTLNQRIHEYAIGLHLEPVKTNPDLLWSHLHLFLVTGRHANIGNLKQGGLTDRLAALFRKPFSDSPQVCYRHEGRLGRKKLSDQKMKAGKTGQIVTYDHLENQFAYALRTNRITDPSELIRMRANLIQQLDTGALSTISRRSPDDSTDPPKLQLPNSFPPTADNDRSLCFPLDREGYLPVATDDYPRVFTNQLIAAETLVSSFKGVSDYA